jgi:hypothetical protein
MIPSLSSAATNFNFCVMSEQHQPVTQNPHRSITLSGAVKFLACFFDLKPNNKP